MKFLQAGPPLTRIGFACSPGVNRSILARGDRRLAPVIQRAWAKGCRFDGWSEWFQPGWWEEAFRETGLSAAWYAHQRYDYGDVLPWDHLDSGLDKDWTPVIW